MFLKHRQTQRTASDDDEKKSTHTPDQPTNHQHAEMKTKTAERKEIHRFGPILMSFIVMVLLALFSENTI